MDVIRTMESVSKFRVPKDSQVIWLWTYGGYYHIGRLECVDKSAYFPSVATAATPHVSCHRLIS